MDKDFLVLDIREGSGRTGLLQQKDWLGAVLVFDIIILMEIRFLKVVGTWRDVADAARTTVRKDGGSGEPSSKWKKRILLAEHSPIRKL